MYRIGYAKSRSQRGTLLGVMAILSAVCVTYAALVIGMATYSRTMERKSVARVRARYVAESAVQQGMYNIAFTNSIIGILATPITWNKGDARMANFSSGVETLSVVVNNVNPNVKNNYRILGTAKVDGVTQQVSAMVRKNPPSKVFDYEYFLNNWGWWWGSGISGNGDQRSNGRFDLRGRPTVNGYVYTHTTHKNALGLYVPDIFIDNNELLRGQPVNLAGLAGVTPDKYLQVDTDRVDMPNLTNMATYKAKAVTANGKLTYRDVNANVTKTISAVQEGNLYLEGTAANPITVTGPVVIGNNVIIKGVVAGQGTIYAGRNVYLVGDVTYKNGPATPRPSGSTDTIRDAWVVDNHSKDLVAFAAKGSILFGDVTNSGSWGDPWGSYLNGWGDERNVGADGIPGTTDDGKSYDRNGDGTLDGAWYDVDGDGIVETGYNWGLDVAPGTGLNSSSGAYQSGNMSSYANWPKNADSSLKTYAQVGDVNGVRNLNGIYYTNHAFAGKTGAGTVTFNGSVISKDEAIIFRDSVVFNYDERVHSRNGNDPNKIIDLGLPVANQITLWQWADGNMFQ